MTVFGIGRWRRQSVGVMDAWVPPADGCIGSIDLRSPLQCSKTDITGAGYGLFVYDTDPQIPGFRPLSVDPDGLISGAARTALQDRLGITLQASRFGGVVAELLTGDHTDASGLANVRALMPRGRKLELILGGWKAKRDFDFDAPEWQASKRQMHHNYRKIRAAAGDDEVHRKVLSLWVEKYGRNWQEFVPDDLPMEEPLPHETTITESFNKADGALGPDLSWTNIIGSIEVRSNTAEWQTSGGNAASRADTDLSSDDHRAELEIARVSGNNFSSIGVMARKDSSTTSTYYRADLDKLSGTDNWRMFKIISGSATSIGTPTSQEHSIGDTIECQADGSTIDRLRNGSSQTSVTDTAISGNLRCGIVGWHNGGTAQRGDNFTASDIAAAGTHPVGPLGHPLRGAFGGPIG